MSYAQDDITICIILIGFYIPIYSPPTGTPNSRENMLLLRFISYHHRYSQKRILYCSVADEGCVGVGESCTQSLWHVCVWCVCRFRRRRQSNRVTDERSWPKPKMCCRIFLAPATLNVIPYSTAYNNTYIINVSKRSLYVSWRRFPIRPYDYETPCGTRLSRYGK